MAKLTKAAETKTNAVKPAPVAAVAKAIGAAKKPEIKAEEKKAEVKPAAKAEDKKAAAKAEKKPVAKKTAKKTTTKRAAKKPVEKVQEVFVEFGGDQFQTEEIVAKIHEAYKAEGHRVGAIKSLRVYINLEHRKAYYVINDKPEDKFVEF